MAASSLSSAATGTTLLTPPLPTPRSRFSASPCLAFRLHFISGSVRSVCSPLQARQHHRLYVAQRAAQTEAKELSEQQVSDESDSEMDVSDEEGDGSVAEEAPPSTLQSLLKDYREAMSKGDENRLAEIESKFQSIEEERAAFANQISSLNDDLTLGKERFLRLNADFENFRRRSEKERIAVSTNVKGDVVSSLLPMVDNFERAKTQIKTETDGEQRIDNSYQGIYKQFVEVMKGFGVAAVETAGKEFDPNIHEAIMREESLEHAEGMVIEEFRKGFKIGDKLLRAAMVKVSAGPPAPAAPEPAVVPAADGVEPETEEKEV